MSAPEINPKTTSTTNATSQKLAQSLIALKALQDNGIIAVKSKQLSRAHRERLLKHGFLKEVLRGWYIPANPEEKPGDSTPWYTSFWDFCGAYLEHRLGSEWCLSPEQSLQLIVGDKTVPQQLLVRSPKGRNKPTALLHGTSVFDIKLAIPATEHRQQLGTVRTQSLAHALVHCSPRYFNTHPVTVRSALLMMQDASDVLRVLISGGHSTLAGRLAGAFRNVGRNSIADNILTSMDAADYKVTEQDPFAAPNLVSFGKRDHSPHVNRIRLMWASMREDVITHFPTTAYTTTHIASDSAKPRSKSEYLQAMDERFVSDAYHSLSIEGYRVTPELIEAVIELVQAGNHLSAQHQQLDAMAAKGYWDAFQEVKQAVAKVLDGENAGEIVEAEHSNWYVKLFSPGVAVSVVTEADLAGYRTGPVYIRQSKHSPPDRHAIRDMLPAFFDLISDEPHPAVRAILGHFIFVYIHPYFDGNGRMGRFIMNLMLASGGYPWTVVPVEQRTPYMQALESASVEGNIVPFTQLIGRLLLDN